MKIEGYQSSGVNATTQRTTGGGNSLSMDDFLALMVAQLSNQDMYNTVDDTQFVTQMAQFSMVQALADLSRISSTSYSINMIGKEAAVKQVNTDGTLQVLRGIVEGVNLFNKEAEIIIEGVAYPITDVIEVKQPSIIIPKEGVDESV